MGSFLRRYSQLLLFVPLWMIAGSIHPILGYGAAFLSMIYWYAEGKQHFFIIAFIFVLILSDASSSKVSFNSSLRIPILFFIMFFALEAVYRGKIKIQKIFFLSFPFFIIAFSMIPFSPTPTMAFAKTISYLFLLFIVIHYFPYTIFITKGRLIIDVAYFVTAVICLAFILIPIYPSAVIWRYGNPTSAFKGFFANPNGFGLFATLLVPFLFILSHIFDGYRKLLLFSTSLFFLGAFLAESRTAMASLLIFFGLYIFHVFLPTGKELWKRRIGNWGIRLFWFLLFPLGILVLNTFGIIGIIEMVGLGEALEVHTLEGGAGRFLAWSHAIEAVKENPWFGKGFHYDVHYFREKAYILIKLGHSGGSHNSYIAFMMNVGIVGLAAFLLFLISLFRKIKGKAKKFIIPYFFLLLMSTNFEAWLASSINYITIFFYLTVISLIYFDEIRAISDRSGKNDLQFKFLKRVPKIVISKSKN